MFEPVEEKVCSLFAEQDRKYAGFPWMYENHVKIVRKEAELLLDSYNADREVVLLAAVLHDVGYLKDHKNHEEVGYEKAKEILDKFDIELSESQLSLLEESITEHGYDGAPESIEAKIIASADALAHFNPRFWITNAKVKDNSVDEFYEWMEEKLQRDLDKICLEEARVEAEKRLKAYDTLNMSLDID